jgi:acyl dehydratase
VSEDPASTYLRDVAELGGLVGSDFGPSPWLAIGQDRVDAFADAVDDRHWAHNDPTLAAAGPFGSTIGHAHLSLSLIVSLFKQILFIDDGGTSMFYGYNRVRFPTAVPVGGRVRLRGSLTQVAEVEGAVQLTLGFVLELEGTDRPACVAESVWRHYPVAAPG